MRRVTTLFASLYAGLAATSAWAHDEERELGHHWGVAEYRSEMWFQIAVMGLAIGLYVTGVLAVRAWKRWSIYRR